MDCVYRIYRIRSGESKGIYSGIEYSDKKMAECVAKLMSAKVDRYVVRVEPTEDCYLQIAV